MSGKNPRPKQALDVLRDRSRLIRLNPEDTTELVNQFSAQIRRIDPLVTTILKAHFEVERCLDDVLGAVAKEPKYLKGERRFAQKMRWLRAFAPLGNDQRWEVVEAFNEVRNNVAHKPEGEERKKTMRRLHETLVRLIPEAVKVRPFADSFVVLASAMEAILLLSDNFINATATGRRHQPELRVERDVRGTRATPRMLFNHYRDLVTPENATAFWEICNRMRFCLKTVRFFWRTKDHDAPPSHFLRAAVPGMGPYVPLWARASAKGKRELAQAMKDLESQHPRISYSFSRTQASRISRVPRFRVV